MVRLCKKRCVLQTPLGNVDSNLAQLQIEQQGQSPREENSDLYFPPFQG